LKLDADLPALAGSLLSALDPGKQGLKHHVQGVVEAFLPLSALDPGKQGLKPFRQYRELVDGLSFSA